MSAQLPTRFQVASRRLLQSTRHSELKCTLVPSWLSDKRVLLALKFAKAEHSKRRKPDPVYIVVESDGALIDTVHALKLELEYANRQWSKAYLSFSKDPGGKLLPVRKNHLANPKIVPLLKNSDLISGRVTLHYWWETRRETLRCASDARQVVNELLTQEHALEQCQEVVSKVEKILHERDAFSTKFVNALLLFAGVYLFGQLTLMVWFTYDVGWDIMEPVSYLIGLATTILAAGFYLFVKREYTWYQTEKTLHGLIKSRIARRHPIDESNYQRAMGKKHMYESTVKEIKRTLERSI